MKKLLEKLYVWYVRRTAQKHQIDWTKQGAIGAQTFDAMYVQKFSGPADNIIGLDSVIWEFFWVYNQLPNTKTFAVPGATVQDALASVDALLAYRPKKVLLHICGNDVNMNARPATEIMADLKTLVWEIEMTGCEVAWAEILPLGKALAEVDERCRSFNRMVKDGGFVTVLPTRAFLAGPDGFIKPELEGVDHLHPNVLAIKAWLPMISKFFFG